jgi:hypothetical protein
MVFAALISWIMTVSAGLYLLVIWLIEYDISAPGGAVTRLPRTVISGHGLLASSGLLVWIGYLIVDRDMLAWIALATLVAVALSRRHRGPPSDCSLMTLAPGTNWVLSPGGRGNVPGERDIRVGWG